MTINKEQAIRILSNFGFKVYNSGKEQYFLQSKVKVKPMTKYSMNDMLKLLNPKEEKVIDKVKDVITSSKPKKESKNKDKK